MTAKAGRPEVVAIGGGRGLAATLKAVRCYAGAITAVVSVADDGGSSGELSRAYGIVAPGDLRKCLVALATDGSAPSEMFEYRFGSGPLEGHSLGNLIITGLAGMYGGILPSLEVCSAMLGCQGRVLPVTTERLSLEAETADGVTVRSQAVITASATDIRSVRIVPDDAKPTPGVIEAITSADQIVVGPGSLYTSVIPPFLVSGVREAISKSRAVKVYVCNLFGEVAESAGMTVAEHCRALSAHGIFVDKLLYHPWGENAPEGAVMEGRLSDLEIEATPASLADPEDPSRHDTAALSAALSGLL